MLVWVAVALTPALACSKPNRLFDLEDDAGSTGGPSSATGTYPAPPSATRGAPGSETGTPGGVDSTADIDDPDTGTNSSAESTTAGDDGGSQGSGESGPRRVFLSSALYTGAMGGVQGADASCQALADAASLGGTWLAFIFDPTYTFANYPQAGGPFVKLDGDIVAQDWLDLTDGSIESPIDTTEYGDSFTVGVWTGLFDAPAATDSWCYGWTSAAGQCETGQLDECGGVGLSHHTDDWWDGFPLDNCSVPNHLYCIEVGT